MCSVKAPWFQPLKTILIPIDTVILRLKPPAFIPLLIAGMLHAVSFAPVPLPGALLPFVQLLSLTALLFFTLKSSSTKAALGGAWVFGIVNFSVGVYWLYISMHQYGGMAPLVAGAALVLFSAFMAIYYVIAIALIRLTVPNPKQLAWKQQLWAASLCASAFTLLEWLRGTFLTGFPWLNIAYAHVDGMFAGWASILGAYGVVWFAVFTAAALAFFALNTHQNAPKSQSFPLGIAVIFATLGIILGGITWHQPAGEPFFARLAQGNVSQHMKFDPQQLNDGVNLYKKLAALEPKTPESAPSIIILPETIVPLFQHQWQPEFWQEWIDIATAQNSTLLLGVPLYSQNAEQSHYTNSAISIDSSSSAVAIQNAKITQRYDKHHLVPFGEFVPPGFRWFIDLLHIPLGDFHQGQTRQPNFAIGSQFIGPDICYEDVFGEEIIQSVRDHSSHGAGATVLVNISNLAWFGDTWALRQHLQIARMRSIETARPMLRATNTGMTAAILPTGELQAFLPSDTIGVLDVEVQGTTGFTPYVRWGNWPIIMFSLFAYLLSARVLRTANHSSSS